MARLVKMYDFKQYDLPDALFQIKVYQKDVDQMLFKAEEHFLTIEEQMGEIQKGDIVAVCIKSEDKLLTSDCERFSVGKGFFSEEIEQALIGKKKGDIFTTEVDGKKAEITVLWSRRRIVPQLTDEMAAKLGIEDVSNKEEYITYVISELENESKEKKQKAIWNLVSKRLAENSEFEMEAAEVENQFAKDMAYLEEEFGEDFEEFMKAKYHRKTLEDCKQAYKKEIEKTIKLCAIAAPMAIEDGVEWSRDDYEAVIADMVNDEYTEEELKESMSYEDYVKQQMEEYLRSKVLEYFDERFTMTLVK